MVTSFIDHIEMHPALLDEIAAMTGMKPGVKLDHYLISIVRKSFDGRWKKQGEPKFVYAIDLAVPKKDMNSFPKLAPKMGKIELLNSKTRYFKDFHVQQISNVPVKIKGEKVIIIGAGPAGKFVHLKLRLTTLYQLIAFLQDYLQLWH